MTEAQNNRTGKTDDQQKVSLTVGSLDRELRLGFKKWLPRFQAAIDEAPGATDTWESLSERCNEQDLEWAFYWAVDVMDTETYLPEILEEFGQKSRELLRNMQILRPLLKEVLLIKGAGIPVWHHYFGFLGLSEKEAIRFLSFQAYFDWFAAKLTLCVGKGKGSGLVSRSTKERSDLPVRKAKKRRRHSKTTGVLPAELPYLYVRDSTGRPHYEEVYLLLELAADAYGLDEFLSRDALDQRYKRLRHDHPHKVKEIIDDISEMWRKRIEDNERIDLIPFLIAREKARAKPIIDYVKALRSKDGMS